MFQKVSKKLPLDLQVYFITVNASEGGEGGGGVECNRSFIKVNLSFLNYQDLNNQ